MLQFGVLSLFPEMFQALTAFGVCGRAIKRQKVGLTLWDLRNYGDGPHQRVDDRPYGGGPGMVMQAQVLEHALTDAKRTLPDARVVYVAPDGIPFTQHVAERFCEPETSLIFIAGRYEGIDQRFIEKRVDTVISIGDYVLSGGELPVMVIIDALVRLVPGVLGDEDSAKQDSFSSGLLDHPHYSRPAVWQELSVPDVLLGGDHAQIERYRLKQALGRTWLLRPDVFQKLNLNQQQIELLNEFIKEQS